MSKVGRPEKPINADEVRNLAKLGSTIREIADFFGVSESTISHKFCREMQEGRASQKLRLRQLQMKSAEKGSDKMLQWLGIQMLAQKNKVDHTTDDKPMNQITYVVGDPKDIDNANKAAADLDGND